MFSFFGRKGDFGSQYEVIKAESTFDGGTVSTSSIFSTSCNIYKTKQLEITNAPYI